jgi:CRP-like cAMP-binding protein
MPAIRNAVKCSQCANTNCLFSLPKESHTLELLENHKTIIFCRKDQYIFYEGGPVNGIYFILSGKVKIFKTGIGGRQQIVRLAKPGDILGHRGFGGRNIYPIAAQAIEDCQICLIETGVFFDVLRNDPELSLKLMLFYADELKNSETRIRNQAQMNIREKIADAILSINDTYGVDENGFLNATLSRQDIGDLAGTNKEQVSRQLSEFNADRLIKLEGKRICVPDAEELRSLLHIYEVVD